MDNKGMKTGLTIARIAIAAIGVILCALIIANAESDVPTAEAMETQGGNLNGALWITYILVVLCAAAAVVFGIVNVLRNPKKNLGAVLGVAGMVLLFIVAYFAFSDNYVPPKFIGEVSGTVSQLASAGLITLYVITVVAVGTVVYAEISKMLK